MKLDLVDVFANGRLSGNPLAVVHCGGVEPDTAAMQALTCWLGYSETTFLLPPTEPQADYRVRIFYPAGELPFAGHPTLGSAFAWTAAGGVPQRAGVIVQQCGIGLVEVREDGDLLAFRAPEMRKSGALSADERAEAIAIAGVAEADVVDAVHADNGPGWKLLRLRSAAAVLAAQPAPRAPVPTDVGLVGPHDAGGEASWEVRAFFANPAGVLAEDPVTGSLNAGVARYLYATGLADGAYVAAQGRCIGADGRIFVSRDAQGVWIGGRVAMVAAGGLVNMDFLK